jgi:uncharacterized membrane protein
MMEDVRVLENAGVMVVSTKLTMSMQKVEHHLMGMIWVLMGMIWVLMGMKVTFNKMYTVSYVVGVSKGA